MVKLLQNLKEPVSGQTMWSKCRWVYFVCDTMKKYENRARHFHKPSYTVVEEKDETIRAAGNSKNREFNLLGCFVKWKSSEGVRRVTEYKQWYQLLWGWAERWDCLIRTVVIPQSCRKVRRIQRSLRLFGAHYCWASDPCYVNMHVLQIAVQESVRFRLMFSQDVGSSCCRSHQ